MTTAIRVKFHLHERVGPRRPHRKGATVWARDESWCNDCQSFDEHRFDCRAVPQDQRGPGPALPVAPTSARQLVDRLRTERAGSAP